MTIGWLLVLQTAAGLIWGQTAYHRPVQLVSIHGFTFPGTSVVVGWDEFMTIVVALGLAFGTAAVLRWTTFGTSMRAVADDPDAARLWGINVNRVMAVSWIAGSAMGAIAGVLITPRINFDPISLTIVVIYAFTAALIGRLTSLPWTVVGAMFLGLAQTYPRIFSSNAGAGDAVTFALVLLTLAILFRPGARLRQRISAVEGVRAGPRSGQPSGAAHDRGGGDRARDPGPAPPLELLPVARGVLADHRPDRAVARRAHRARRPDLVLPVLVRRDRRLHRRLPRRGPRLELLAGAGCSASSSRSGSECSSESRPFACRASSSRS